MTNQKINQKTLDIDILGSIEFDLTEAIKDLFYNIKLIKNDIEIVRKEINLTKQTKHKS